MIQMRKTSVIVTPNSDMGTGLDKMSQVIRGEINKIIPLPNLQIGITCLCLTHTTLGIGMLCTNRVEVGPLNTLGLIIHYGDSLVDTHIDHRYRKMKRVNLCHHKDRCVHRNL